MSSLNHYHSMCVHTHLASDTKLFPYKSFWQIFMKRCDGMERLYPLLHPEITLKSLFDQAARNNQSISEEEFVNWILDLPLLHTIVTSADNQEIWDIKRESFLDFSNRHQGELTTALLQDTTNLTQPFFIWMMQQCDWLKSGSDDSVRVVMH